MPKTKPIGILGRPLGATAPCHTSLESSFQGQYFHRKCLYLLSFEPFKSKSNTEAKYR